MSNVIVVLGCGRVLGDNPVGQPVSEGATSTTYTSQHHSYARLKKAEEVAKLHENALIVCSGYHGQSEKMKKKLVACGIRENRVFKEPYSRNTIENCIFTYELIKKLLDSETLMSPVTLHLVTNEYHMHRSEKIFRHFGDRLPLAGIQTHPGPIFDYLSEEVQSQFGEEMAKILEKENQVTGILENWLKKYQGWHPVAQDYAERLADM